MKMNNPVDRLQKEGGSSVVPLEWDGTTLRLIDQRLLPHEEIWLEYRSGREVASAITDMVVRGAPAIGITAAFGLVLEAKEITAKDYEEFCEKWYSFADLMVRARPTAVNLRWAVNRLGRVVDSHQNDDPLFITDLLEKEAILIWQEDIDANLAMGRLGQELLPDEGGVLTHCNAGALATGGYGTALGVIRAAVSQGKRIKVFADETRPWLQGARLTAWELVRDGIPVALLVDSAAGFLMRRGEIGAVVVGADRIAANGDVANKIGTYSVAELAQANGIPFYVAAPVSTLDPDTPSGDQIPIEERPEEEVLGFRGSMVAPAGVAARNLVFDITPHHLVTAIITEKGVLKPPYGPAISGCLA